MTVVESKQGTGESKRERPAISVKNVLYATDFSSTAEAAFPYATAICRRFGSTLHVVHVISDANLLLTTGCTDCVSVNMAYEDVAADAQEKIKRIASRLRGIPHRSYVRRGQIWPNLRGIATEGGIDLLVVGSHGRTGLGKLLLGSVAEDVLRHASCPVLTVGPRVSGRAKLPEFDDGELAPPDLELREIIYATSFTPASLAAAQVAIELAEEFDSRLTLLHVREDYANLEDRARPIDDEKEQLRAMVPKDAALAYAPEVVMEFGSAWRCIVNKAAEEEADLIVLGAHRAAGTTHVPWSTVHQVVAHASCPVLTVRE